MSARVRCAAVLLAGGAGRRAGGPKQFRKVAGRTLLEHAAHGLCAAKEIGALVVVVPRNAVERVQRDFDRRPLPRPVEVTAGGATRHLSSRAGLAALRERWPSVERVLIHDAARPFASARLLRRLLRGLRDPEVCGVIPAVAVHDSTVLVDGSRVARYVDREKLRAVQTPQAFRVDALRESFARTRGRDHCDDAIVLQRRGLRVDVVEGERENLKITTVEQLRHALKELRASKTPTTSKQPKKSPA